MELQDFFKEHPKAAIAFSGGVDSTYLLAEALRCGADVRAYCAVTAFQPAFEKREAAELCARLGAALTTVELDVLSDPAVTANPPDRCYHCKKTIFTALMERASADGYALMLDGTNASDDASDRPGMRALREFGVLSPLRICGLTKAEIRRRSRELGLPTWDKPAYACLATRVPTGETIDVEKLRRVEGAETALREMGYADLRVRLFHDAARLQLPGEQLERASRERKAILEALKPWFKTVLLDLEER
jgi:uncharacterized protein